MSVTETSESSLEMTVEAEEGLWLRTVPDGQGGIQIALMPPGAVLIPMFCQNFDGQLWIYGTYENQSGWSSAEFLSGSCDPNIVMVDSVPDAPLYPPIRYRYVCVDEAGVYGAPRKNPDWFLYTIPRGEQVRVLEMARGTPEAWAMIETAHWVKWTDLCE